MKAIKYISAAVLICCAFVCDAQKRGNVWCFGHHAAIDFNSAIPTPDSSSVISRGSCASISDTSGNLLFYASDDTVAKYFNTINGAKIYSKNHQLMQNGDSINAQAWFYEIVIVPHPTNDSLYYVFTIGVTSFFGIYYSMVDISFNGGLGLVTQKNVQLQNFEMVDCLTAIKHGNGRDWWILFRKFTPTGNNLYFEYLITPSGISNLITQSIGSQNSTNSGNIEFNILGNQIMYTNLSGLMEYFDFDRCTGIISNTQNVFPEQTFPYTRLFWDGQYSSSGDLFYTTMIAIPGFTDSCYLIQYDLTSSNIPQSADTLLVDSIARNMSQLKLAPDHKIYLSSVYNNFITSSYPYPDTVYSIYNTHLGVINSPDSLGTICDFQPFSFYLGGSRTYAGLPNNPDYDMPKLAGSPCDSLKFAGIQNIESGLSNAELNTTYISQWQKLFVNAQNIKGRNCVLQIFDINGREVFSASKQTQPPYFTHDVNCNSFANGMYIVSLTTDKEKLTGKFVKE